MPASPTRPATAPLRPTATGDLPSAPRGGHAVARAPASPASAWESPARSAVMPETLNPFGSRATLAAADGAMTVTYFRLDKLAEAGAPTERLSMTVKILVENLLRQVDGVNV